MLRLLLCIHAEEGGPVERHCRWCLHRWCARRARCVVCACAVYWPKAVGSPTRFLISTAAGPRAMVMNAAIGGMLLALIEGVGIWINKMTAQQVQSASAFLAVCVHKCGSHLRCLASRQANKPPPASLWTRWRRRYRRQLTPQRSAPIRPRRRPRVSTSTTRRATRCHRFELFGATLRVCSAATTLIGCALHCLPVPHSAYPATA